MTERKKLVVLVPISSAATFEGLSALRRSIEEVLEPFSSKLEVSFLFTANKNDSDGSSRTLTLAQKVAKEVSNSEVLIIETTGGGITDVGAGRYVRGFYEAALRGDYVIELDSEDHDPRVIDAFVKPLLEGKLAVMSSRFMLPGAKHKFILQRKLASVGITLLANCFLRLGMFIPDMASGYEGYSSVLLREVYGACPWQQWLTLKSTTTLINTELRAKVLWSLLACNKDQKENVVLVPIVFGDSQGAPFPSAVVVKALKGFWGLIIARNPFIKKIREAQT